MRKVLAILLLCVGSLSFSQQASMTIDRPAMRIGEQTLLHLYFEYSNPKGDALIIWPEFDQNITRDIEVVDQSIDFDKIVDSTAGIYLREQQLVVTAFEEGEYEILGQEIWLNDSLFTTNPVSLTISTVEVDTTKGITDIKPIYAVNYPFSERSMDWLKENWMWLTIIGGLILLFIAWRIYQKRKPEPEDEEILEEIIPAHIIAMETLNKLLKDESWKTLEKKGYYSTLTDTVRSYLENRFGINAMEKTTREIINDLKFSPISEDDKVYLRKILREADLVKFAKFSPSDEEACAYLNKSIDFVQRTKESELKRGN